jgi:hypothetical protein
MTSSIKIRPKAAKSRKFLNWLVAATAILIALLLFLHFTASILINLDWMKDQVLTRVQDLAGVEFRYDHVDAGLFPRPRVTLHEVTISVPALGSSAFVSMTAEPQIAALLRGRIQLARLHIESPSYRVEIPSRIAVPEKDIGERKELSEIFRDLAGRLEKRIFDLMTLPPDLIFTIDNGEFDFIRDNEIVISFSRMHIRLTNTPDGPRFRFTSVSNLAESISLEVSTNAQGNVANGRLDLAGFRGHILADIISVDMPFDITEAEVNLGVSLHTDGFRTLDGTLTGSIPKLFLVREGEDLDLQCKNYQSRFSWGEDRMVLKLDNLDLTTPGINLSGEFRQDFKDPLVQLNLVGEDVDITSVRKAALFLLNDIPAVRSVFGYLRDGHIPSVHFTSRGQTAAELDDLSNFTVEGNLRNGEVFVEGPDLRFTGVEGEVTLINGVLEGKEASGSLGKNIANNGIVRIGLAGENAPFHIEASILADLSQVPPILERLVKNRTFLEELERFSDVAGEAEGKLTIGDRLDSLKTSLDLTRLSLTSLYSRLPFLIKIHNGEFFYSENDIGFSDITGLLGQSSFSEVAGRLDLAGEPRLESLAGNFDLRLDEVGPILSSLDVHAEPAGIDLGTLTGEAVLSLMSLTGPLLKPAEWDFEGEGSVRKVTGETNLVPAPVSLDGGRFRINQTRISFDDVQTGFLDADLLVRGHVEGYMADNVTADLTIDGELGEKSVQLISQRTNLPSGINFRAPLRVENKHLSWAKSGEISLRGDLISPQGSSLYIDLTATHGVLDLKRLTVDDPQSRCDLTMRIEDREVAFSFTGNLALDTIDRIFTTEDLPSGYLAGEIMIDLPLDHPQNMTTTGRLEGKNLAFLQETLRPLRIDTLSVSFDGNRISFDPAAFSWKGKSASITGEVDIAIDDLHIDRPLPEWQVKKEIIRIFKGEAPGQEGEGALPEESLPFTGAIKITLDEAAYDRFSLGPLIAHVTLQPESINIIVKELYLCGMDFPASFYITNQDISADARIKAEGPDISSTADCLLGERQTMTGEYRLLVSLKSTGGPGELVRNLYGRIDFQALNGRIQHIDLMASIFAFLNVTELFRGKFPDVDEEGFSYKKATIKGNIKDGVLIIEEAILDSSIMDMATEGRVDLAERTMSLPVLTAPLKTANFIVSIIPVIRHILGGKVVVVPIKVKGEWKDPKVTAMAPSAVGTRLLGILKNTVMLPVTMVEPMVESDDEGTENSDQ